MKRLLIICISILFYTGGFTQDSVIVTGEEYMPLEVRGETPAKLEGTWTLQSGMKKSNKKQSKAYYKKKPEPGTETKRSSETKRVTKNGVTTTTTETEVEFVAEPVKQITPKQGDDMHKPGKPNISFFGSNETFTGFTGCNKYSGRYTINGNRINIRELNPSTKMVCIGDYNEQEFLNKMNRVNAFKISNGSLHLLNGNKVLLSFSRK